MWLPTGDDVPLEYDATKYKMYVSCRKPTEPEMKEQSIHWVDCHIDDLAIDSGHKPVRRDSVTTTQQIIDPSQVDTDPALVEATMTQDPRRPRVQFEDLPSPKHPRHESQQQTDMELEATT
eukprot:13804314-Ditylum_brightwellii.AAC.1